MSGIEIKTDTKKACGKEPLPLVTLFLLEAGVFGVLLYLKALDGVDYRAGLVLPVAAFFCCALGYSYRRHEKLFRGIVIASVSGCILSALILGSALWEQLARIAESLMGKPVLRATQMTGAALLIAVLLTLLLFALECSIEGHAILCILTSAMLLASPLLGIHVNVETVFLLVLFQLAFWVIQITAWQRRKGQLFAAGQQRLSTKSGEAISIAVIAAFGIALPVAMVSFEKIYTSVYAVDGLVRMGADSMTGSAGAPVGGGHISGGNTYPAGIEHLELVALAEPTETLYLRGFVGGEYIGGDWKRNSDEALLGSIVESHPGLEWASVINSMYYNLYFFMNTSEPGEELPEPITLMIQHVNDEYGNTYAPYYSRVQSSWGYDGYIYQYYERKDMNIDWWNVTPEQEEWVDWYLELQTLYLERARDVYTQVPTELLPRLTALVEAYPLTDLDDITAFILYTLEGNAAYTRTPGWATVNEDVVESFLFERRRGYCQHYAAAATLMYRLYGVPARYVTGYVASPSDFEPQGNGRYRAVLADESAHAWVEIFLEDYGWTPVEVTPAGDGSQTQRPLGSEIINRLWGGADRNTVTFDAMKGAMARSEDASGQTAGGFATASGSGRSPAESSSISRGNAYRTGEARLELTASSQPTENLYLRGFGGGEYTGGNWLRCDDGASLKKIAESHEDLEWTDMINGMYRDMYFVMNSYSASGEPPEAITLMIQHTDGDYAEYYVPYYSKSQSSRGYDGYIYRYYERWDMDIDWENVPPEQAKWAEWYRQLQEAYMEQARETYTEVPTELLPRLTELVEENPLTDLTDISAFIRSTLHNNASYTLTPNWTDFDVDVVEYFLFESGEGYCQHFAAAATLMYRLYGIPARYATGYVASPSDFEQQRDGTYRAVVTDETAHAWVEIFLEDYGWTPVEVTPAGSVVSLDTYPASARERAQREEVPEEAAAPAPVPLPVWETAEALRNAIRKGQTDFLLTAGIRGQRHRDLRLILISCLGCTALLSPMFINHRRLARLRKAEGLGCRAVFSRLVEMLHFGGILSEYSGVEEEFADRLSGAGTGISEEESRRLVSIVSRAAYGPARPDEAEEELVRRIYHSAAEQIYAGLPWPRRLIFKYVKAFG